MVWSYIFFGSKYSFGATLCLLQHTILRYIQYPKLYFFATLHKYSFLFFFYYFSLFLLSNQQPPHHSVTTRRTKQTHQTNPYPHTTPKLINPHTHTQPKPINPLLPINHDLAKPTTLPATTTPTHPTTMATTPS